MKPWALITLFLISFSAKCETSLELIREVAESYTLENLNADPHAKVTLQTNTLDSRRHFGDCDQPIQASSQSMKPGTRYTTVKVSCEGSSPWLVYVPIQIDIQYPVVIATTTLAANAVLDSSMLEVRYVSSSSLRGGHFSDIDSLAGARLKRRLAAGQVINQNNICIVCRGDPVVIQAISKNLAIRTSGTALTGGALGESIRVQNTNSRRMVDAVVSAIGQVKVVM